MLRRMKTLPLGLLKRIDKDKSDPLAKTSSDAGAQASAASSSARRESTSNGPILSPRGRHQAGPGSSLGPPKVAVASPRTREEILADLNPDYFEEDFDPASFEIRGLPFDVNETTLEEIVIDRVGMLEVLNEQLSDEVQSRSERIVSGVNEVASVEHEIQVAHIVTKNARRSLRVTLEELQANNRIASMTRQKQMLLETLQVMVKLHGMASLEERHAEYQDAGDFSSAISSCDQCISTLASDPDLCQLKVSNGLADAACDRYRITMKEMDTALLSVCGEFNDELYSRILGAYQGLPDFPELAEKVQACFSKVVDTNVNGVVWSYVMQRGVRADRGASLSELCKQLPAEIFRPCLSKVLEVVFDILRSHWQMQVWHVQQLAHQQQLLEVLMARKGAWEADRATNGPQAVANPKPEDTLEAGGAPSAESTAQETSSPTEDQEFPEDEDLLNAGLRYEVLQVVLSHGLQEGREGVWDAGARCVQQLLNSPGAAQGEHFLQVLEWMHRFIKVGEAFSSKNAGWLLRDCLARQSGAFFAAFHHQNQDALGSMLEKEPWRPLPGCSVPSLRDALRASEAQAHMDESETVVELKFKDWVEMGNPFRDWSSRRRRGMKGFPALQLGFEGSTETGEDDSVPNKSPGGAAEEELGGTEALAAEPSDGEESEDEPEELRGDFIDEESQLVHIGAAREGQATSSGRGDQPTITTTSLKLFRWMVSYGQLMRLLGTASPAVFKGLCDLFDAYIFHIFHTFGNISVAQLADEVNDGGGEEVTPRLRKTLMRIAGYPADYTPGNKVAVENPASVHSANAATTSAGQNALTDRMRRTNLFKVTRDKLSGMGAHHNGEAPLAGPGGPNTAMIMSSGNMFALKERSVAVESLMAIADEFLRAKSAIQAVLPPAEAQRLDHFCSRTVDAAGDLQEHIFHTASLRLLDLSKYPVRIAETKYDVSEVGCQQSSWVDAAAAEVKQFAERLTVAGVGSATRRLMWDKAMDAAAQIFVDGLSRVKRCTIEGRAGMSLDLQTFISSISGVVPDGIDLDTNMRIVDTYIKAFYVPETELVHWAHTHPEYTRSQLVSLVTCIADSNKMKRKALKELLVQIESAA